MTKIVKKAPAKEPAAEEKKPVVTANKAGALKAQTTEKAPLTEKTTNIINMKEKANKLAKTESVVEATPNNEPVDTETVNTNPEDFMYQVKVDSKKYDGRTAEQVESLVFGVLGSAKKITIEKQ